MKKFKLIYISVVLLISTATLWVATRDINNYKPFIEKTFYEKTPFKVTIHGTIGLNFFPVLRLDVQNVMVFDKKKPFTKFATLHTVQLNLEFKNLVRALFKKGDFHYDGPLDAKVIISDVLPDKKQKVTLNLKQTQAMVEGLAQSNSSAQQDGLNFKINFKSPGNFQNLMTNPLLLDSIFVQTSGVILKGQGQIALPTQTLNVTKTIISSNNPKISLHGVSAILRFDNNTIVLTSFSGHVFDGTLKASGYYGQEKISLKGMLNDIAVEKIPFIDLTTFKAGLLSVQFGLNTQGHTPTQMMSNITANVNGRLTHNKIYTTDIKGALDEIRTFNQKKDFVAIMTAFKQKKDIMIDTITVEGRLQKNIFDLAKLQVSCEDFSAQSFGALDFNTKTLKLNGALSSKSLPFVPQLKFTVTGPLESPSIGLDQKQIQALVTKTVIKAVIKNVLKKNIDGSSANGISNVLEGLAKRIMR